MGCPKLRRRELQATLWWTSRCSQALQLDRAHRHLDTRLTIARVHRPTAGEHPRFSISSSHVEARRSAWSRDSLQLQREQGALRATISLLCLPVCLSAVFSCLCCVSYIEPNVVLQEAKTTTRTVWFSQEDIALSRFPLSVLGG